MLMSKWHDHTPRYFCCAVVALWSIDRRNPVHFKAVFGLFTAAGLSPTRGMMVQKLFEVIFGFFFFFFSCQEQENSIGFGPVLFGMNVVWACCEGERIYLSNRA